MNINTNPKEEFFNIFKEYTITELEEKILNAKDREEKIFYAKVLDIKVGLAQEKAIGEELF